MREQTLVTIAPCPPTDELMPDSGNSSSLGGGRAGRCDRAAAQLAADQWGIIDIEELRACGLSSHAVGTRTRSGHLHRLHRGVYAVGHPNPPTEGRFLAAVKAVGPHGFLSHYAGAAHWDFVEWDERVISVTVRGRGTRGHSGIRIHRTTILDPVDVRRHRGIPVTAPARTLLDLAASLPERGLRSVVRRAQSVRRVTVDQLAQVLIRLGPRRGSRKLARIIASGPAPTASVLEDVVLDLILRGGLAHPDVNRPMRLDARRVIPDFRWPEQRLVVEADSVAWHDNRLAREDDAERQALLEAHGERVIRVTWEQAMARGPQTLTRIRNAGAPLDRQRTTS